MGVRSTASSCRCPAGRSRSAPTRRGCCPSRWRGCGSHPPRPRPGSRPREARPRSVTLTGSSSRSPTVRRCCHPTSRSSGSGWHLPAAPPLRSPRRPTKRSPTEPHRRGARPFLRLARDRQQIRTRRTDFPSCCFLPPRWNRSYPAPPSPALHIRRPRRPPEVLPAAHRDVVSIAPLPPTSSAVRRRRSQGPVAPRVIVLVVGSVVNEDTVPVLALQATNSAVEVALK